VFTNTRSYTVELKSDKLRNKADDVDVSTTGHKHRDTQHTAKEHNTKKAKEQKREQKHTHLRCVVGICGVPTGRRAHQKGHHVHEPAVFT